MELNSNLTDLRYNSEFPSQIQIEITTFCNFDCTYCIRQSWESKILHFPFNLFERLAKNNFSHLERIIFLGIGEPLTNPDFDAILDITQRFLPPEGKIEFTSNGMLLTPAMVERLLKAANGKLDRIIISIDSPYLQKLKKSRPEVTEELFTNLEYLAEQSQKGRFHTLGIEAILMKTTLYDLPDLVDFCTSVPVDALYLTHILPHTSEAIEQILFSPISKESWDYARKIITKSSYLMKDLFFVQEKKFDIKENFYENLKPIQKIQEECYKADIDLNADNIWTVLKKRELLNDVKEIFTVAQSRSDKSLHPIHIDFPPIFPVKNKRHCPYVDRNAAVITIDGNVAACYDFMHKAQVFLNGHQRDDTKVYFGNLNEHTLQEIWKSRPYMEFRKNWQQKSFVEKVPWCGDCPYSTADCFYTLTNAYDCIGNEPGCHECMYSADLVKCLFDPEP